MVWQPEIDELKYRKELAAQMGGPEGIGRQRKRGKLTVRERIAAIADPDSFDEIGAIAGSAKYEGDKLVSFTPANLVLGLCTINGRKQLPRLRVDGQFSQQVTAGMVCNCAIIFGRGVLNAEDVNQVLREFVRYGAQIVNPLAVGVDLGLGRQPLQVALLLP